MTIFNFTKTVQNLCLQTKLNLPVLLKDVTNYKFFFSFKWFIPVVCENITKNIKDDLSDIFDILCYIKLQIVSLKFQQTAQMTALWFGCNLAERDSSSQTGTVLNISFLLITSDAC